MKKFIEWLQTEHPECREGFGDMMQGAKDWFQGVSGLSPELKDLYRKVQADPKLKQDYEFRISGSGRRQSPQQALMDIAKYDQLNSFQHMKNFNPTGQEPKQAYHGDLRKGDYEPRDMTKKVIGRDL